MSGNKALKVDSVICEISPYVEGCVDHAQVYQCIWATLISKVYPFCGAIEYSTHGKFCKNKLRWFKNQERTGYHATIKIIHLEPELDLGAICIDV